MTRPITKAPPNGSRLERYVKWMQTQQQEWAKTFDWIDPGSDPALRKFFFAGMLKDDPRIWVHPRALVRDELVLPAVAALEGEEAAGLLRRKLPQVLEQFTDLICEKAKRDALARKRIAPDPDISWAVELVVMAVLYDGYDSSKAEDANFRRAAKRLGITRSAVRRISNRILQRAGAPGVVSAIFATQGFIAEVDRVSRGAKAA